VEILRYYGYEVQVPPATLSKTPDPKMESESRRKVHEEECGVWECDKERG